MLHLGDHFDFLLLELADLLLVERFGVLVFDADPVVLACCLHVVEVFVVCFTLEPLFVVGVHVLSVFFFPFVVFFLLIVVLIVVFSEVYLEIVSIDVSISLDRMFVS